MALTVHYYAGARAAAGTAVEALPAGTYTLEEMIEELVARHGPQLAKVLAVASFLVDGTTRRDRESALPADATVDVLPPFAGG